jgi:hypothetical protein
VERSDTHQLHFAKLTGFAKRSTYPSHLHFRPQNLSHQKSNFARAFNAILHVQILRRKYSALRGPQINRILSPIPPHCEGRFAIVTNVDAGCGGRGGVGRARQLQGGRQTRERSSGARRTALNRLR